MEFLDKIIGLIVFGLVIYVLIKIFISHKPISHKPRSERIGEHGENLVAQYLSDYENSIVFNDIIFFDENTKKSSQIDHIVIRSNGVFVIETKNYAGRVYGDDSKREWTQVLAYGKTKNRFYNPIKQNATHIYYLAKILKQHNIYVSVVVFPRAELYTKTTAFVCNERNSLYRALASNTGINLTPQQMQNISDKISEIKANPAVTKEEHIQGVQQTQHDIAQNICPRCGKTLVMRNGKSGIFYGCSGYPICHFTKNIL